jgi:hypothetical protein
MSHGGIAFIIYINLSFLSNIICYCDKRHWICGNCTKLHKDFEGTILMVAFDYIIQCAENPSNFFLILWSNFLKSFYAPHWTNLVVYCMKNTMRILKTTITNEKLKNLGHVFCIFWAGRNLSLSCCTCQSFDGLSLGTAHTPVVISYDKHGVPRIHSDLDPHLNQNLKERNASSGIKYRYSVNL